MDVKEILKNGQSKLVNATTEIILHIENSGEKQLPVVYVENQCDSLFTVEFSEREVNSLYSKNSTINSLEENTVTSNEKYVTVESNNEGSEESEKDQIQRSGNNKNPEDAGLNLLEYSSCSDGYDLSCVDDQAPIGQTVLYSEPENKSQDSVSTSKNCDQSVTEYSKHINKINDRENIFRVSAKNLKSVLKDIKLKKLNKKKNRFLNNNNCCIEEQVMTEEQLELEELKKAAQLAEEAGMAEAGINKKDSMPTSTERKQKAVANVKKGKKPYVYVKENVICPTCGTLLSSRDSLRQHNRRFHREKNPFPCNLCGKVFLLREDLRKHVNGVHAASDKYVCDICGSTFRRLATLKLHKLKEHNIGEHQKCELCGKEFATVQSLKRHYYVHESKAAPGDNIHGDKPHTMHTCELCHLSFSTFSTLNRHQKMIHYHEKPFQCDVCSKAFVDAASLKRHTNTHTHFQACFCYLCNKSFSMSSSLKRHMMTIHSLSNGNDDYECDICNKAFKYQSSLKRHYLIHSNSKPYKCELCNMSFRHISAKARHIKLHGTHNSVQEVEITESVYAIDNSVPLEIGNL